MDWLAHFVPWPWVWETWWTVQVTPAVILACIAGCSTVLWLLVKVKDDPPKAASWHEERQREYWQEEPIPEWHAKGWQGSGDWEQGKPWPIIGAGQEYPAQAANWSIGSPGSVRQHQARYGDVDMGDVESPEAWYRNKADHDEAVDGFNQRCYTPHCSYCKYHSYATYLLKVHGKIYSEEGACYRPQRATGHLAIPEQGPPET